MAWKQILAVLVVAAVSMSTLPAMARATEYVVGDERGWNVGVNYTEWAQGKAFVVGDSLVFNYTRGDHNVLKVDGANFRACKNVSEQNPLETGNDTVPLKTAGQKWYICGKDKHCESGQKLVITVLSSPPATPPAPTAPVPATPPSPTAPVPATPPAPTAPVPATPPAPTAPVPGSSNRIAMPEYRSIMVVTVAVLMTFMI